MSQGTFTTKKVKTLPKDAIASSLEAAPANALKVDYGLAAPTALQKVQHEFATKEVEQWVRSELENTELRKKLNTLERTVKEQHNHEHKSRDFQLNVISGKTFEKKRKGMKIISIISVAGYRVHPGTP